MRIHYVMHAAFEKLGAIETWALAKGHSLSGTHIYKDEQLPVNMNDFDFLIFMGGPQSPLELDKYPYIIDEINLAKKAIEADKIVFGVCLGAQIIAEALGAATERSPNKEIGIYPVSALENVDDPFFNELSPIFNAVHWHNDMPGLPAGADLLARSEGCPCQAFRFGDKVYGFQFHLELTQELIEGMIANCPNDLVSGKYIRTEQELRSADYNPINRSLFLFLDKMEAIFSNGLR